MVLYACDKFPHFPHTYAQTHVRGISKRVIVRIFHFGPLVGWSLAILTLNNSRVNTFCCARKIVT